VVDRLEIAKQLVAEQVTKRDDVVGALLFGSVARGEDTDTSDIDLAIYVRKETGEGMRDMARWLRVSLDWALDYYRTCLAKLGDAIASIVSMNPFGICANCCAQSMKPCTALAAKCGTCTYHINHAILAA